MTGLDGTRPYLPNITPCARHCWLLFELSITVVLFVVIWGYSPCCCCCGSIPPPCCWLPDPVIIPDVTELRLLCPFPQRPRNSYVTSDGPPLLLARTRPQLDRWADGLPLDPLLGCSICCCYPTQICVFWGLVIWLPPACPLTYLTPSPVTFPGRIILPAVVAHCIIVDLYSHCSPCSQALPLLIYYPLFNYPGVVVTWWPFIQLTVVERYLPDCWFRLFPDSPFLLT